MILALTKKNMNSKQFKKELALKNLDKIYLFTGEEEGEKEKIINEIIKIIFNENTEKNNSIGRFHIENDELLEAADFAISQSMFSMKKICIMKNIDSVKQKKNAKLILSDLFGSLPKGTTLIMTTRKNRAPDIINADMLKNIKTVQFWRYFENEISGYIKESLKKNNMNIDNRAAALILKYTGNNIKNIDEAVERLKFSGQTENITAETVKDILSDISDVTIYEFIDSLFLKEKRSLELFKKIIGKGIPELYILNLILRQCETLEKYYSLIKNNVPPKTAVKNCGVFEKNFGKFMNFTKNFPEKKIRKIFPIISGTDFEIKSSGKKQGITNDPLFVLTCEILFL